MFSTRFWLDNERDTNTKPHTIKPTHQQGTSNHLLELQKEIKEEEEEIFADINSLINSHHESINHSNQVLDSDLGNETDFIEEQYAVDESPAGNDSDIVNETDFIDEQYVVDDGSAGNQSYEALQTALQVTSNLPKPCIFFLEGNCRRSDCKYSHDLSNITCKYWIEGFCFKGELCPFLHSYNPPSESSLYDEEAVKRLTGKELNPTFVIESEADFPSLPQDAPATALNDSTQSSMNADAISTNIKNQILSSNPAVVFKIVKKKRKKG